MKKIAYLALALTLCACGGSNTMPEASKDFAVEKVKMEKVSLTTSYPATLKGVQDIEIRPKVSGHIVQVLVDEGDFVRAGQPLFVIDKVQYEAAVRQAEASVNVAKANVNTQRLTVENKKYLFENQIISEYDYNVARNQLASLEAQLQQANAALISARNNLDFCTVKSPANGVVGTIPYRVGSLVSSSGAQPLTTVSNMNQMYVYFSMTEKQLLAMTRAQGGVTAAIDSLPEVQLVLADGSTYEKTGRVTAISGVIDTQTGAVQMRATFDNTGHVLRSGGAGNVLIPMSMTEALQVPQNATYDIQDKKYVYVLGSDKKVQQREITVLSQHNGQKYVVTSGLKAGETIVVEGVNQLRAGQEINPITPAQSAQNREKAKQALKDGKMPGEN